MQVSTVSYIQIDGKPVLHLDRKGIEHIGVLTASFTCLNASVQLCYIIQCSHLPNKDGQNITFKLSLVYPKYTMSKVATIFKRVPPDLLPISKNIDLNLLTITTQNRQGDLTFLRYSKPTLTHEIKEHHLTLMPYLHSQQHNNISICLSKGV